MLENRNLKNLVKSTLWIAVIVILGIAFLIYCRLKVENDLSLSSAIYGSIFLIIVGLLTAIVTYIAFKVQWEANKKHCEQFDKERKDMAIERFENRFFKWVDFYSDFTAKMIINQIGAEKNAFHYMFYEFKHLYSYITDSAYTSVNTSELLSDEEKTKVSFCLMLNGVSSGINNTIEQFCTKYISKSDFDHLIAHIHEVHGANFEELHKLAKGKQMKYLNDYVDMAIRSETMPLWFDGHRQLLVVYFNFFSIIIEYVLTSKKHVDINTIDYLKYIKLLITEHEAGILQGLITYDPQFYAAEYLPYIQNEIINIRELNFRYNSMHPDFLK